MVKIKVGDTFTKNLKLGICYTIGDISGNSITVYWYDAVGKIKKLSYLDIYIYKNFNENIWICKKYNRRKELYDKLNSLI